MIKLIDIKKAVNKQLKEAFPDVTIVAGELKEGFERPSFFTYIQPVSIRNTHLNYIDASIMVTIPYYPKTDSDVESLRIQDGLYSAFGLTLEVEGQKFILGEKYADDLEEGFQLKFMLKTRLVYKTKDEGLKLMEQLNLEGI